MGERLNGIQEVDGSIPFSSTIKKIPSNQETVYRKIEFAAPGIPYIRSMLEPARRPRHIPDASADCLTCACGNPDNKNAVMLLRVTESVSATGVIAAVFAAPDCEHANLVCIARTAIAEERVICDANDRAARETCWRGRRK